MAIKKFFTTESLKTFVDEIKTFVSNAASTKANTNHTHTISNVTNLQTSLDLKVNVVSGKGLSTNDYTTTEKNKLANISDSADAVSFSRSLTSGIKIGTITINGTGTDLYAPTDTDTHYTTHMYAGDGSAADKATTNGNTKISVFDNSTIRDSITIKGTGATTVTSDANGVITINSTDNNTTYSAAGSSLGLVKSGGDVTISSGVITVNDDSHNHTIANVDNLQSSLDAKQATITGGASTITTSNLTANMALVSDGSGKVAVSAVTSTELGYLDGVKSNVQTQLDGKAASSHGNHVPATQTANNAKFLRNDNTWQTVTPANIGAATSGHTHNNINMQNMSNKDLNTIKTQGWYYGYTGMTNAPVQAISVMEVIVYSQDWIMQRFTVIGATPVTYERHYHTGTTWSPWFTNVNSGNIASQSVASATKATQDASGNVIASTYETKVNASSKLTEAKTYTDTVASGKADVSHTHTEAAQSANKLNTDAGDANTPVYFSGGKPVACTSLDLNTSGSSASCTGNSATATKLQTARTIALGTGVTGTATSFNGTGNITIPVTDVKESYLSWGGRNLSGAISPLDAACSNVHSANRFAFAKAAGITIEYSTNGSTYSTYSTTDSAKVNLVSGVGSGYYIGARSTSTTVNDKLRITLNATNMGLYTRLQKLLINISTNYATGSNVIVEKSMKGSESTYTTVGTYTISGWSGWNSIPISAAFGGGDTQTYNIANIRLTFGITGVNSSQTSNALTITDIVGIGDTYWSYPSTMAKTGHLYSYDSSQNATFPANVSAQTFTGSGVATLAEVKTYLGI